jgi:glutamate dehydrogenase
METGLLLRLYDAEPSVPLFELSEMSSERIFALQDQLESCLGQILADGELVWKVMLHYVPSVLREKLGEQTIMAILNAEQLQPYRNAIITKKLASMAFYRFGERWEEYLGEIEAELLPSLHQIFNA